MLPLILLFCTHASTASTTAQIVHLRHLQPFAFSTLASDLPADRTWTPLSVCSAILADLAQAARVVGPTVVAAHTFVRARAFAWQVGAVPQTLLQAALFGCAILRWSRLLRLLTTTADTGLPDPPTTACVALTRGLNVVVRNNGDRVFCTNCPFQHLKEWFAYTYTTLHRLCACVCACVYCRHS